MDDNVKVLNKYGFELKNNRYELLVVHDKKSGIVRVDMKCLAKNTPEELDKLIRREYVQLLKEMGCTGNLYCDKCGKMIDPKWAYTIKDGKQYHIECLYIPWLQTQDALEICIHYRHCGYLNQYHECDEHCKQYKTKGE